jgi:hypothetical protein
MAEYSRESLFEKLDQLKISRIYNTVITEWRNRVICSTEVSDKYEIFDIVKYFKDKIDEIEKSFKIEKYFLNIKGGKQSLDLISEEVEIAGKRFQKTFHMQNSTDRSRRLGFNTGLYSVDDKYILISAVNQVSLYKAHIKGVTQAAEDASAGISNETFDEQISALKDLVGHRVAFSKIRGVILGDDEKVPQIAHKRFDNFVSSLKSASRYGITKEDYTKYNIPRQKSEYIKEIKFNDDFFIDAFDVIMCYLRAFGGQETHIIKNESERIMKITQWSVRNDMLAMLGI